MRRNEIVHYLLDNAPSLIPRGSRAALARRFAVSGATISRDTDEIYGKRMFPEQRRPFCGAEALDPAGTAAIGRGPARPDRRLGLPRAPPSRLVRPQRPQRPYTPETAGTLAMLRSFGEYMP